MKSVATTVLAVVLGLSLLAGCGSDDKAPSKADYAKGYKPINDEFVALGQVVAATVRTAKGQTDVALVHVREATRMTVRSSPVLHKVK